MEEQGQCGICLITGPLEVIQRHFEDHIIPENPDNHGNDDINAENVQGRYLIN